MNSKSYSVIYTDSLNKARVGQGKSFIKGVLDPAAFPALAKAHARINHNKIVVNKEFPPQTLNDFGDLVIEGTDKFDEPIFYATVLDRD